MISDSTVGADVRHARVLALCLAAVAVAYVLTLRQAAVPARYFLPIHLVLEFSSIVISFAVFLTGWFGYNQTKNPRDLVIGVTFAFVAVIDFVHTLSYKGMPSFLASAGPHANPVGLAAAYWLVARTAAGVGLVWASLLGSKSAAPLLRPRPLAAAAAAAALLVLVLFTTFAHPISNAIYNVETRSLTPLKVGVEYAACILYLAAFLLISERRGWAVTTVVPLRSALIAAVFSEFSFTLYSGPYDWFNFLGHILKIAAFGLILNGLFVSALKRPYAELRAAKSELESLYAEAREYASEVERSFSRIGSALSSSLELNDALNLIARLAAEMLRARCAIVSSVEENLEVARWAESDSCRACPYPIEMARRIGGQVLADRTTRIIPDISLAEGADGCDLPDCANSMLCAPMMHGNTALGVIAVYSDKPDAFNQTDAKLLEGFATHAATATHNAMSFQRESRIADALQKAILNPSPVTCQRFEIAHTYQPAFNEAMVGGDFYDVVDLGNDKIGIAIGDVSGKGLRAAVHTAMAKYSLRAYLKEQHSTARAMRLLNQTVVESTDTETFITMFVGVLDLRTGEFVYVNAGHEPPVYANGDGVTILPSTGLALGIEGHVEFEEKAVVLDKGAALVLYTDGISEARNGEDLFGIERVAGAVASCTGADSSRLVECVHQAAVEFAGGHLQDDVAIVAIKPTALPPDPENDRAHEDAD